MEVWLTASITPVRCKVSRGYTGNCRLTAPGKMPESVKRSEFPDTISEQGLLGKRGNRASGKVSLGSLMCQSFVEVSTARG